MVGDQVFPAEPLDAFDRALRGTAVGVRRPVEQRLQRLSGANPGVVQVLPDRRDRLGAPLLDLVLGKHRIARDVGDDREHVAGSPPPGRCTTASARGGWSSPSARRRDRRALRRSRRRIAWSVPRSMSRPRNHARPGEIVRLLQAAGPERHVDRDGGRERRLLDDHHGAVRAAPARTGVSPLVTDGASRLVLQRPEPADRAPLAGQPPRGDVRDLRGRHRLQPRRERLEVPGTGDGLEVADLVRDVRDAVGLEDEPGPQLPFRARDFVLGQARLPARVRSPASRPLRARRSGTPSHGRERRRCRETARASAAASRPPRTPARCSTSAVYSRARRCGGAPRKLDQMFSPFAPVSAASSTSIGKKSSSRGRRRMPRELQVGRRPLTLEQRRGARRSAAAPPAASLRRRRAAVDLSEMRLGPPQHVVRVHVADDDERGVGRARSDGGSGRTDRRGSSIGDRRSSRSSGGDRVRAERGRGDLGVEQLVRIVLAALQLRDDDGALGLALLRARTDRAPSARPR